MYTLPCDPASILYIAENKTLAGKEDCSFEWEALGRKLTVVFFEKMPMPGSLVQRVNRETVGMQQNLLSIAEILQTLGAPVLPADQSDSHTDRAPPGERVRALGHHSIQVLSGACCWCARVLTG